VVHKGRSHKRPRAHKAVRGQIASGFYDQHGRFSAGPSGDMPRAMENSCLISKRKRLEHVLFSDSVLVKSYLDIVGVIMIVIDQDGSVTLINKKGCELLGLPETEILGKDWVKAFIPEHARKEVGSVFRQIMSGKLVMAERFENTVLTKRGGERLISWRNTAIRDKSGHIISTLSSGEDITELRKAELSLKESEEKFRRIVESSQDLIMLTNPDGRIAYLGPACKKVLGWEPRELLGKRVPVTHPDDSGMVDSALATALSGKSGTGLQYRIVTKAGETKWVSHTWSPIMVGDRLKQVASVISDITERKLADVLLRESEDRYKRLVELSPNAIVVHDGRYVLFANQAALRLLGASKPDQVVGSSVMGLVHPDFRDIVRKRVHLQRKGQIVPPIHEKFIRLDGKPIDAEVSASPIIYGGTKAMLVVIQDITEKRKAELALKESESRFRKVFESSPVGILLASPDFRFMKSNPAASRIFGYPENALRGLTFKDITHPDDLGRDIKQIERLTSRKISVYRTEKRYVRKDGKVIWGLISVSAIRDENGNLLHYLAIVDDITDQKRDEVELRLSKEKVEDMSRMRERFMADIAHELKTPLSVILLNLDLMKRMEKSTPLGELAPVQDLLWRNARRIGISIEQIMQLTSMGAISVRKRKVDIVKMMRALSEDYAPLASSKGISFQMAGDRLEVESDPRLLAAAVSNLISNAIKFTSKGSVKVSWKSAGGRFCISVSDTGNGIRPENLPKIFNMFFKEDFDAPGSGIGLSLSAEFVKRMGGTIKAVSKLGKGSRFTITIPKR
jgi:two-component system NtrC family sensor kinase